MNRVNDVKIWIDELEKLPKLEDYQQAMLEWSKQNNPGAWIYELPTIQKLGLAYEPVKKEPELLWWQKERIAEREQKEAVIALRNEVRNIVGFFN